MLIRRKVLTKRLLIVLFALIGVYCLLLFGNLTTGKSLTAFNYDVQFSKCGQLNSNELFHVMNKC